MKKLFKRMAKNNCTSGFLLVLSPNRYEFVLLSCKPCGLLILLFSFPGLLDDTVAGGIPSSGMSVFETLVEECMEEAQASIGPDIVRKYARAAGSISYFSRSVRWFHGNFHLQLCDLVAYSSF